MDVYSSVLRRCHRLKRQSSLRVLGERIRQARKAKGWSQEDLALQADVDRSYCGGLERGQRNPSFKKLCALALALGCDVGSLCAGLPTERGR